MPRQPGDISKADRTLLVLSAVKSLGRASPDDVLKVVSRQMANSIDDKNLRRNIYRDLKTLSEAGRLGVQYYTPDGLPISPDEEVGFKNVRVEYFIPEDQSHVLGHRLLTDRGGFFMPSPLRTIAWRLQTFAELKSGQNTLCFIFEANDKTLLNLSLPHDELPVKILVARDPGPEVRNQHVKLLGDSLGARYGALYLNHRTVSRADSKSRFGHAVIEVSKDGKNMMVADLGSTSGTLWAPANPAYLRKIANLGAKTEAITLHPISNTLTQDIHWSKLSTTEVKPLPALVLIGSLPVLVAPASVLKRS